MHSFLTDVPKVFSQQIVNSGPAVVITEGDSATITCEKSTRKESKAHWIIAGSDLLQNGMQVINDTNELVELKNGLKLDIKLNARVPDTNTDMEQFGITISYLTPDLSGLTVRCVVCWEEENICQPYHQAAVIAVIPQNMSKMFLMCIL